MFVAMDITAHTVLTIFLSAPTSLFNLIQDTTQFIYFTIESEKGYEENQETKAHFAH